MSHHTQKKLSLFLAAALVVALPLRSAPLADFVEADADIYLSLRSLAESRQDWDGHPFAKVIDDPGLKAFFEPWMDAAAEARGEKETATEVLENEFGLTWDELFERFPGQVTMALYNLPEMILGQAERPDLVIMAEYTGETAQLEALMQVQFERNAESHKAANPAVEHRLIEESFMGESLYFDEVYDGETTYIEDGYALVDGIFILATPETRLRSAVEAVKDEPNAPLAENPAYLRAREEGGRGDLALYLNLEAFLPVLNTALLDKAMSSGGAMFGVSAQSLDAALSLESMQGLFFDLELIDEGMRLYSGLIYREKAGLLRLMTYTGKHLPEARYVPEGVFSTSVTNLDLGAMFAELEKILITASPMMRMQIDAQLQTIRTNTGVDLRMSVLENFGDDLVSLSILPKAVRDGIPGVEPDQVIAVGVKNAEALSSAFEALKDLVPGMREQIETKTFAGETIHTIRAQPNPQAPGAGGGTVSYVITRGHFLLSIGRPGLLQEVLSALETGGDGFWQRVETEILFDDIAKSDAISRSYVNLEKLAMSIFQSLVRTSQFGGANTALDPERIPRNLAVPFRMVSEASEADDGIFSRVLILEREGME